MGDSYLMLRRKPIHQFRSRDLKLWTRINYTKLVGSLKKKNIPNMGTLIHAFVLSSDQKITKYYDLLIFIKLCKTHNQIR